MIVPEPKDFPPMPMLWVKRRRERRTEIQDRGVERMNEGRWIIVTNAATGRRQSVNLRNVCCVSEASAVDIERGISAEIHFVADTYINVKESFDEIGAMIR